MNIKPSQICSPTTIKPILAPSQFGSSNPFSSSNPLDNKFGQKPLLKPPKLGTNSASQPNKSNFTLNPSRLNPFARTSADDDTSDRDSDKHKNSSSVANGETPKFVPLLHVENKNSEVLIKPVTAVLPTAQVW